MIKEKLIKKQPFANKLAIICGGSKGIGKATAKLFVQLGGNACIVARTLETLNSAAKEIEEFKVGDDQIVDVLSCDTSNSEQVQNLFTDYVKKRGVPDYLFNYVGISLPNYTEKLSIEDFKFHMDTNFFGQLNPIKTILPYLIEERNGHIINMSSISGFIGLMGYAAYTPTKFAIVGLSEGLRNEYKPFNIKISVIFPPDTDTPGLHEEAETRPEELNIIAERGGLLKPEDVAETILKGVLKKKFYILPGSAKFMWRMMRFFPKLVHWVIDGDLKKARKKMGKDK
ncbi:MAG: SDR family oxidoreductase [Candidatus Lokiarchaeota archaeon]|nr:SDR family oxidoreductase [Candidatus Lokiarchaeota archaeon]